MPIVSGTQVNIAATTETPTVLNSLIKIILGGFALISTQTQTPPALTGRDRSPRLAMGRTEGTIALIRPLRRRRSPVLISGTTETPESRYVVSPAIPAPEVHLFHDLKAIENSAVIRGASFDLSFIATGWKLSTLWVDFQIKDLSDRLLIHKRYSLNPGGAIVDESVLLDNGMEQIKGTIFILPEETKKLPEECKFAFLIGNNATRKYEPICGHLTFTC